MFPVSLPGLAHAQHTPLVHQTGPFRPVEFLLVPKHLHSLPGGGVPHQKIFRVASLNWGQSFHWGLAAWPVPGLSSIHAPSCPLVEDASASRALQGSPRPHLRLARQPVSSSSSFRGMWYMAWNVAHARDLNYISSSGVRASNLSCLFPGPRLNMQIYATLSQPWPAGGRAGL